MTISDLPRRLRARAVALAAAELARSSWLRSEPNLQKGTPEDAPSAATSGDLGGPNASDSTPAHGPPAAQPATNAARDPVGASSVASPFAGGARPNGMPAPPGSTHPEVRRTPFAVAVGPIARFFLPETTPAYGGRVSLRVGRMHAGSDFVAQFPESLRDLALGVATLWSAWDMVFYERPRFRAAVGPHVALGVAWSPAYARSVAVSFPASGGALASEASDREPGARTAFYAEGAVAAEAFLQVGPGWACGAILELGAAWGAAATSLYPSQSDVPQAWHPVQAGAVGGPTMGASLVLGYTP